MLAGQSNMSGYAPLPRDNPAFENAYVFANDYQWKIGREPVDGNKGQKDWVSYDNRAGSGPGIAFARVVYKSLKQPIGLIPCAKGASHILQWQKASGRKTLYGSCLHRLRLAQKQGRLAGLLFFQGEADAKKLQQFRLARAEKWPALFKKFVTDFRADVKQPGLPVVFAQIGETVYKQSFHKWQFMQQQQASVKLANGAMITTSDLPTHDGLHFTAKSYQTIGQRFAMAYLSLRK